MPGASRLREKGYRLLERLPRHELSGERAAQEEP
jgi:hypothetical protein